MKKTQKKTKEMHYEVFNLQKTRFSCLHTGAQGGAPSGSFCLLATWRARVGVMGPNSTDEGGDA